MTERRRTRRYELSLPITLQVPTEEDRLATLGKTRNFSTHGILFTIDHNLAAGAKLDATVTLSGQDPASSKGLVHVRGRVVRVENRPASVDVAAVIDKYEFVREHPLTVIE